MTRRQPALVRLRVQATRSATFTRSLALSLGESRRGRHRRTRQARSREFRPATHMPRSGRSDRTPLRSRTLYTGCCRTDVSKQRAGTALVDSRHGGSSSELNLVPVVHLDTLDRVRPPVRHFDLDEVGRRGSPSAGECQLAL